MARALELAREFEGRVSPNPSVGAVVVKNGHIVGEGNYRGAGTPHAEAAAIEPAGGDARGAAIYVTLEPHCHQGSAPPCTEAILRAGISEVHFAHIDPDARVAGRGKEELERAGVRVVVGEGELEARRINEAYCKQRATGLPFVIAKFAASLDGKIAATSGDSRWVSGPETLAWSHELRTRIDTIAVGVSTVLIDNPQLTARPGGQLAERQPLRIVLDSRGRTPRDAAVLSCDAKTLVATTKLSPEPWRAEMEAAGAHVAVLPSAGAGRVELHALLELLGQRDVLSLLVEGGGVLHGSFFDQGLVDKVHAVIAPLIIGGAYAPAAVAGKGVARMADALRLRNVTVERLGDDVLVTGYTGLSF
jgi:diaminohydroxyphosphoribosylaminopyrimidine deaminase/5-amino-6-(5-phosphoribosylamino)uracil reductase